MIKDKLIPLGITFTIIAGAVGCDIANDKPVEETPVEVEESIETKPRVVRPTKIQSLYLNIELGMEYDKAKKLWDDEELDTYTYVEEHGDKVTTIKVGYKKDKQNRYGDKVNYDDVYEFTGEYIEITLWKDETTISTLEYHNHKNEDEWYTALDEEMYPALKGKCSIDWHYFESKEEQINYLQGGM